MKTAILHVRWLSKPAQRFVFASMADAIESAHVVCARFKVSPEGLDWKENLAKGAFVRTDSFTMQAEETDFHSDALTPDEPLPEPVNPVDDPICKYVLMRRDVPQYLTGRACAQSNHGGTAFVLRALKRKDADLMAQIEDWADEGDGFGTTIVKSVTDSEMRQAVSLATLMGLYAEIIHDPEYFVKDGAKTHFIAVDTCAFVFGRVSACKPVVGRFPLLKEDYE